MRPPNGPSKIIDIIEDRPGTALLAFLSVHFVVWTTLPAAIFFNPFLDVIEALTYGREWQLGSDKLPPLPWWLVEITYQLFKCDAAIYALSQIVVISALLAVWALARRIVGASTALLALLLIDGMNYFHFTAVKFNHNVMQLPFWGLAGFAYWAALKEKRLIYWGLLGVALGLALWAKYFVVVLALPLALFLLWDREARRTLATVGPYFAVIVAAVVVAPHFLWLVQHDFALLRYADDKWAAYRGPLDHVFYPARFLLEQAWYLAPCFLIAAPLFLMRGERRLPAAVDPFDRRIITLLSFGPAITLVAMSLVAGRGAEPMWGYPLWLFLGLWCLMLPGVSLDRRKIEATVAAWAIVFCGFALAFVLNYRVIPALFPPNKATFAGYFPGQMLGTEISTRYRHVTGEPLHYVIGSLWIAGNVAHYAPEQPHVLVEGSPSRAPWINLDDLRAKGAVLVWTRSEDADSTPSDPRILPPWYKTIAANAVVQEPFTLPYWRGPGLVEVGWAVLPPR
jgi:hypothetical protein